MSIAIQTNHLSHRFSAGNKVLDDVNLAVPEASIYGFLGPNGAGKTTTLRLILGLIRRQEGEIAIMGKSFEKSR
ncbi:MAG: ATP-binding cassette domain-containing protein, partial [Flavobacteriales bacterium]